MASVPAVFSLADGDVALRVPVQFVVPASLTHFSNSLQTSLLPQAFISPFSHQLLPVKMTEDEWEASENTLHNESSKVLSTLWPNDHGHLTITAIMFFPNLEACDYIRFLCMLWHYNFSSLEWRGPKHVPVCQCPCAQSKVYTVDLRHRTRVSWTEPTAMKIGVHYNSEQEI